MRYGKFRKYTHAEMSEFTHQQLSAEVDLIFVYDRTQEDVDRIKYLNRQYLTGKITDAEREEWEQGITKKYDLAYELGLRNSQGLKGAFNLEDIERIEWNTQVIADLLDVAVDVVEWKYNDIPRVMDYKRIRENVQKLRNSWFILTTAPDTPIQPLNTYQKWNDIEKILHDVYVAYIMYLKSLYYCDTELYAGEGIGDI